MRVVSVVLLFAVVFFAGSAIVIANSDEETEPAALIDSSQFRPQVAFHDIEPSVDSAFVTITGVVFSRSPVDRVTVGDRVAMIRPTEPKDLLELKRAPNGASEAPFRTYFEVPDAALSRFGANDIEVRAVSADGRISNTHRLTILRSAPSTESQP